MKKDIIRFVSYLLLSLFVLAAFISCAAQEGQSGNDTDGITSNHRQEPQALTTPEDIITEKIELLKGTGMAFDVPVKLENEDYDWIFWRYCSRAVKPYSVESIGGIGEKAFYRISDVEDVFESLLGRRAVYEKFLPDHSPDIFSPAFFEVDLENRTYSRSFPYGYHGDEYSDYYELLDLRANEDGTYTADLKYYCVGWLGLDLLYPYADYTAVFSGAESGCLLKSLSMTRKYPNNPEKGSYYEEAEPIGAIWDNEEDRNKYGKTESFENRYYAGNGKFYASVKLGEGVPETAFQDALASVGLQRNGYSYVMNNGLFVLLTKEQLKGLIKLDPNGEKYSLTYFNPFNDINM